MQNLNHTQLASLPLAQKLEYAKNFILNILTDVSANPAIGWTGGKDSTVMLWLTRCVCREANLPTPQCIYIDDGDVFPEISTFVASTVSTWDLNLVTLRNDDLLSGNPHVGDHIQVSSLSENNKKQLLDIGVNSESFVFEPESFAGSHLTKTVPLLEYISAGAITHFFVGIRWDEQEQRKDDNFIQRRENPEHQRVHPILHLTERDIWNTILEFKIPFCELYRQGYRSLGARSTTRAISTLPAWEQDLENTEERQGRGQEKEAIMDQLRSLGYM